MFDGWTDRYKARPYLGVRISFLDDDWRFTVVTLGCHVLPSHTAKAIADHVSQQLKGFFSDTKKLYITSCHDGAANMLKTSKLLKVDNFQHCAAHSLHLLLTTDSINQQEEVTDIIQKCRRIVTALHFKTTLLEDEMDATKDKVLVDKLQARLADVSNLLDMEEQFAASISTEETDQSAAGFSSSIHAAHTIR